MAQPNPSPSSPLTFSRQQFNDALLGTDMAVTDAAANSMTTRVFAAAAGQPLTGTLEALDSAQLTAKSLGALLLMAGFAPDRPVASQLGARLWAQLNGIAEPEPAAPPTPAKTGRDKATPEATRELNATVLADKSRTFERAGYMLQVMATAALDHMKRGIRGRIVREFRHGPFRLTIRVSGNSDSATISIFSPKRQTDPLYRTCSINELWQFACPRDPGSLDKIAKSMMDNAELPVIKGGREDVNEYAEGVLDQDDAAIEGDRDADVDDADDEGPEDREPTMRELLSRAKARKTGDGPRQPR